MRELALEGREEEPEAGTPRPPGHLQCCTVGGGRQAERGPLRRPHPATPAASPTCPSPRQAGPRTPVWNLPVRAEGRPWPRSPGQWRETQCSHVDDGSSLHGLAPRGGPGSSAENQGPGMLVSGAADPTGGLESAAHSGGALGGLAWGPKGVCAPAPCPGPHTCPRVRNSPPPPPLPDTEPQGRPETRLARRARGPGGMSRGGFQVLFPVPTPTSLENCSASSPSLLKKQGRITSGLLGGGGGSSSRNCPATDQ